MELLEREGALAALAEARDEAALGSGRVVFVSGEPGIGKSSLVRRFAAELGPDARVLVGTCDDLSIPRPLGAIRDLVGAVSEPLVQALAAGAASHEIQSLLIAELRLPARPTVLVLEDVHWADDATLDTITVLGRRIGSLPAVLVLTYRGGEAPAGHPLRAAVGGIHADQSMFVELAPLSERAVASLVGGDGDVVFAATRGNPFYVTELLACQDDDGLPPSIANAVLGRAARLDEDARRLVELVSVVPGRVRASVLDQVMPDWPAAAEEPERRQLLELDATYVRFRHELARNAIRSSLPIAARRRLHGEILAALLAAAADPSDIVHHAEAAGERDVVAEYALVAARRAARLASSREAYRHYRRVADFVGRMALLDRGAVLEELAEAAYLVDKLVDAFSAIESAIAVYQELDDPVGVGRSTRFLSRLYWFAGEGTPARAKAHEAIAILEPLGESVELARAYSGFSQLAMLSEDIAQALLWGGRALELADRLDDESTRAHALVNVASAKLQLDHREIAALIDAHTVAHEMGDRHEATRALCNLGYTLMYWGQPAQSLRYTEQAHAYAREHEVHNLASYTRMTLAWLRLRAGEWDEAERISRAEIESGITVSQLLAKTVLAELAVRRGDPDAADRLADLEAHADRAGDLQRVVPVLELATERGLTYGTPMPTERFRRLVETFRPLGGLPVCSAIRMAGWAAVAGIDLGFDASESASLPAPFAAMLRRDWLAAAGAFGAVGWDYDRALMLSLLDDEGSLVEAIELARGLGAVPLTRRVAGRMRALGLRVPHGPREATRANPAGLTARQLEVLALLARGLTNAEIADRLVVSPRTAEHHVAAVLTKVGAASRRDAVRRASELGLLARR